MKTEVRKGLYEDLPAIYSLVKELAVYEKAGDQVTASLADYQNDFSAGLFECLVAESDEGIIGMMLYYMTYSTWKGKMVYLEDFVVNEAYRKKKVGQMLFNAFLSEAENKKARLVKWQVLDWNEPAIKFYEKNEATIEKEWWNCKVIF